MFFFPPTVFDILFQQSNLGSLSSRLQKDAQFERKLDTVKKATINPSLIVKVPLPPLYFIYLFNKVTSTDVKQFDAQNGSLNGVFEVLEYEYDCTDSFFFSFFFLSRKGCISSLFRYCLLYMNVCFSMHFLSLGFFGYRLMTSLVPIFWFLHAVPSFWVFKFPLPLVFSCP